LLNLDLVRVVRVVVITHLGHVEDGVLFILQRSSNMLQVVLLHAAENISEHLSALRSEASLLSVHWFDRDD